MSKYQSYTAYASLWNKSFPSHWSVLPMYALAKEKSICGCVDLPLLSVYLDVGVIPFSAKAEKRTNVTSKDLSKYQRVDCGDFVLNNQQAWRGSVGISFDTGIVSPAYIVLSMNDMLNSRYANYILRSRIMVDQYLINSKSVGSIQRNIYWPALKRTSVPVPPREEQDQIVRFLDWKVSNINKMIAIKEKRRSLIFDLIQLYLFSDDASQFSIGRIENAFPKNWESIKAKHIFSERKEKGHAEEELLAVTQDKGVVFKKDCDNHYVQPSNLEDQKLVCPGDFIISLRSFQGGIEHSRIKGLVSAAYTVMELSPAYSHIEEYYGFLFKSKPFIQYLNSCVNDIRDGKKIDYKDFRDCSLPIPPISTLEKINALRKEYDNATEELNRYATLLRELRMCIISDTVTGKIDVRGIEIPEYEFVDEDNDNVDENLEQGADEPPEEE